MKKVDMIVKAPFFYTMQGEGVGFQSGVAMVVDGSKIMDFVPLDKVDQEYEAEEVLDMSHHAIFSGLHRRAHAYSGQHFQRTGAGHE